MNGIQMEEVSKLKEELDEWKSKHELLQGQLREKDSVIEKLVSKIGKKNCVSAQCDVTSNSVFKFNFP